MNPTEGSTSIDNYETQLVCTKCKNSIAANRINKRYLVEQFSAILNFEKGFFFTLKQMTLYPGKACREFIAGNRQRYMKPILFLILCSLIYSLLDSIFHFEDEIYASQDLKNNPAEDLTIWMREHYGYVNIITSMLMGFWIRIFFRKEPYNIFEIIVLICFITGATFFIYAFFGIIQSTLDLDAFAIVSWGLSILYSIWAVGQFFKAKKVGTYLRILLAYLVGYLSFIILTGLLTFIYMLIYK